MHTVCIFGDSITWGVLDADGGGWCERLKRHYWRENPLIEIYNLGISGDDTAGVLARFDTEVQAREPDTVMFAIGINDAQRIISESQNRTPLEQFRANIKALVGRAKEQGVNVVFVGITRVVEIKTQPISWAPDISYTNADIEQYDAVLREVAQNEALQYIKTNEVLAPDDIADGVHPNAEGHQKLFMAIRKDIETMIK